jgi:hypothetical protein
MEAAHFPATSVNFHQPGNHCHENLTSQDKDRLISSGDLLVRSVELDDVKQVPF